MRDMPSQVLVADVGGTNARLALAGPDGALSAITRYPNEAYGSFYEVLHRFATDRVRGRVGAITIAVAGPVTSDRARLTNRDWTFEREALSRALPEQDRVPVRLVNDLAALGHSLPALGGDQVRLMRPATGAGPSNGQALVVGIGTGFNVCLAKSSPEGSMVIEAELGHSSLPASVVAAVEAAIGKAALGFPTTEDLFSGRGLVQFYRALSGGRESPAHEIVDAAAEGDALARQTVEHVVRYLSLLTRQLVFQYLPLDGIYFAGSVARGLFGGNREEAFLESLPSDGPFEHLIAQVPLRVIADDAAALFGLTRLARPLAEAG